MAERPRKRPAARSVFGFLGEALGRCLLHSVDTQSAALAFYTLFALAPSLLVAASVGRRFLGDGRVHGEVVRQFQGVMGADAGLAAAAFLEKAAGPGIGTGFGAVAGIVAFVLGSTAVFIQLQEALNRVWEVAPKPGSVFRTLLKKRLASFFLVAAVGFVLLVSLVLSTRLLVLTDFLTAKIRLPAALVTLGNEGLSFLVLAVLLALVYRVLPDAVLEWGDVALGALVTSLLFSAGKGLIGLFLGLTAVASRFGVAGSLVLLLLWVYFASTIVLFGAELTAVHSRRRRRIPVQPEPGATAVEGGPGTDRAEPAA